MRSPKVKKKKEKITQHNRGEKERPVDDGKYLSKGIRGTIL